MAPPSTRGAIFVLVLDQRPDASGVSRADKIDFSTTGQDTLEIGPRKLKAGHLFHSGRKRWSFMLPPASFHQAEGHVGDVLYPFAVADSDASGIGKQIRNQVNHVDGRSAVEILGPGRERLGASGSDQQSNSSRSSRLTRNLPLISGRGCSARHI